MKNALPQFSSRPIRPVRSDDRRVPILEVGHELVCRSASVMPRRSENQSLHTEQMQKDGYRLGVPGRMLHPGVRPLPQIGRKTRCPPLERQRARLVPQAEDVVRVGREVLRARYPNGYRQTQQQQEREPEGPQHIPVNEERNPEYERHIIQPISTKQFCCPPCAGRSGIQPVVHLDHENVVRRRCKHIARVTAELEPADPGIGPIDAVSAE